MPRLQFLKLKGDLDKSKAAALKRWIVLVCCTLWILISIVRAPASTGTWKDMSIDSSWVIGLAASLQEGAIAGRDFQFTYGPVAQLIASVGAALNIDRSAYPALPMIVLCFWLYGILLFAGIALILSELDWRTVLLVCVMGSVLNLFSEPTSFRNLSLLLCAAVFYRTVTAKSKSTRFVLASLTGVLALWAQLTSLDLGLYAVAMIISASVGLALLPAVQGVGRVWDSANRYITAGGVALAAFTLGNILLSFAFRASSNTYGNYAGLFEYQRLSLDLVQGYNLTTGAPWSLGRVHTILLIIVVTYTIIVAGSRFFSKDETDAACILVLTLTSVIALKSALLRSDIGHISVACGPLVLVFLILGRDELTHRRRGVLWIACGVMLVWMWPWSGVYAFNDLRTVLNRPIAPLQKMINLRRAVTPPEALPPDLQLSLSSGPAKVFSFPYDTYIGSAINQLFVPPALQNYAAPNVGLQRYYVWRLQKHQPQPALVYGVDDIGSPRMDEVQHITRSPGIFQYIYENYELQDDRHFGNGFYILAPRSAPVVMNFTPVQVETIREHAREEIRAPAAVPCLVARLNLRLRYPVTIAISRPAAARVTFLLRDQIVESSRLVPLDNGRSFSTMISLTPPSAFFQLFNDSQVSPPRWDKIQIDFSAADFLDVGPSSVEVLSIECFNKSAKTEVTSHAAIN